MNFLQRLWLALLGRPVPNPREQHLRTRATRLAAVAHGRAEQIRRDRMRDDYSLADQRLRR